MPVQSQDTLSPSHTSNASSWGHAVGSFPHEDVMADASSPYHTRSPSFHSSAYLPKMEAKFFDNFHCCGLRFKDLHGLTQHSQEAHLDSYFNAPCHVTLQGNGRFVRKSGEDGPPAQYHVVDGQPHSTHQSEQWQSYATHVEQVPNGALAGPDRSPVRGAPGPSLPGTTGVETLGDMELDCLPPPGHRANASAAFNSHFDPAVDFLNPHCAPPPPFDVEIANIMAKQGTLITPVSTHAASGPLANGYRPSLTETPILASSNTTNSPHSDFPMTPSNTLPPDDYPFLDNRFSLDPETIQRMQDGTFDFSELDQRGRPGHCVNEPAKSLFANGNISEDQHYSQESVHSDAACDSDEAAKRLQTHHLAANVGIVPGEGDRPFTCPVIGCEKAYKNANGLRYHERHGHATQKLKQNSNGTFSIINPETALPYPGTLGMEKEKPYRCDFCGKRYKNLNGLKYHRNHSPPCVSDFTLNKVALGNFQDIEPAETKL